MSKPLIWFPEGAQRKAAAQRRAANPEGGIGKVAAQDFLNRKPKADEKKQKKVVAED